MMVVVVVVVLRATLIARWWWAAEAADHHHQQLPLSLKCINLICFSSFSSFSTFRWTQVPKRPLTASSSASCRRALAWPSSLWSPFLPLLALPFPLFSSPWTLNIAIKGKCVTPAANNVQCWASVFCPSFFSSYIRLNLMINLNSLNYCSPSLLLIIIFTSPHCTFQGRLHLSTCSALKCVQWLAVNGYLKWPTNLGYCSKVLQCLRQCNSTFNV